MSGGRRIVVTAGAGGIGLAIARAFAADGDRVHICDIDEAALQRATDGDPAITGTVCDVSDRRPVAVFVEDAVRTLGGLDVLVNNAGGHGVRVNTVAPGAVEGARIQNVLRGRAEATGRSLAEVQAEALAVQSLKRLVDPDEIAALCVYLASENARSITGQTIPIDGGSKATQ
jgi:NAD(P)-dependent dehydrogenase (short-subunit alcohol dehydrogenase family)